MTKTFLMVLGFAVVLACGVACFGLSSKKDKTSPLNNPTNSISTPVPR